MLRSLPGSLVCDESPGGRWSRKAQGLVCLSITEQRALPYCFLGSKKKKASDFPGGPVVKNSPADGGDMGSIPDLETKIPYTTGQLSPCTHLLKSLHLDPMLHNKRSIQVRSPHTTTRE